MSSRVSFAFSGCGWLTPFHLGVVKRLTETNIIASDTLCSGTSGGALAALVAVNNINCDDALQFVIETANDRKFRRDLNSELKLLLHKIVPAEAVSNCNGRLYICVTKVWPNPKPYPTIISKFQSFDNLVNVVAASCFIPIYSNRKSLGFATRINSSKIEYFIDGGVHAWMPPIGDIRVSPFNPGPLSIWRPKPHISLNPTHYSQAQLFAWTVRPPPTTTMRNLYAHGYAQAQEWIDRNPHVLPQPSAESTSESYGFDRGVVTGKMCVTATGLNVHETAEAALGSVRLVGSSPITTDS